MAAPWSARSPVRRLSGPRRAEEQVVQAGTKISSLDVPARRDEDVVRLDEALLAHGLADVRWLLHDVLLAGARRIVIDLSRVHSLGSSALASFLRAHRVCRARDGAVVLRRRPADPRHGLPHGPVAGAAPPGRRRAQGGGQRPGGTTSDTGALGAYPCSVR